MSGKFNDIIVMSQDKKGKKGDGVNAVLVLMKEIREFQDKVDDAMESQTNPENAKKISAFNDMIEKMYEGLLEIASQGIRRTDRKEVKNVNPVMMGSPIVPKM